MADVVIVTPNPAIDVTYRVDDQTPGETHRVREISRRPGGKGINVARGLEALGHTTVCVLPLGGASGIWISDALTALGLSHSITPIDGLTRTTVTITEAAPPLPRAVPTSGRTPDLPAPATVETAHPTVYSEAGPPVTIAEWDVLIADTTRQLADARMLIISGSLPPATDTSVVAALVACARAAGVPVIVDASGDALLAAAAAGADVVKPNQQELLEATGADSPDAAITQLMDAGARTVVVSRGVDGIVASSLSAPGSCATPSGSATPGTPRGSATPDTHDTPSGATTVDGELRRYEVPAVTGVHGNPTGAGDAATAGLAAALLEGRPLDVALTWAAALGAAAVLRPVAGEVDLAAFHQFLSVGTAVAVADPEVPASLVPAVGVSPAASTSIQTTTE